MNVDWNQLDEDEKCTKYRGEHLENVLKLLMIRIKLHRPLPDVKPSS
jgi:hypothetical protein